MFNQIITIIINKKQNNKIFNFNFNVVTDSILKRNNFSYLIDLIQDC